jgi:hypothetical protein
LFLNLNNFLQERELSFGMRVLPCHEEPGVEIFGYAPQFSPKNISHVFYHADELEIPGKNRCFDNPPNDKLPNDNWPMLAVLWPTFKEMLVEFTAGAYAIKLFTAVIYGFS